MDALPEDDTHRTAARQTGGEPGHLAARRPDTARSFLSIFVLMMLRVGTSGFSYKEWKGSFYPEDLKAADMLSYYAQRLGTVEINNTFYRLPTPKLLGSWASQVPEGFQFVLKVSQKITHFKRLNGVEEEMGFLLDSARTLGVRLGPFLVQIPPNFKRDDDRLAAFLGLLPPGVRAAFEVRHPSWLVPEVFALLEKHGVALVASQTDEEPDITLTRTAPWGYVRLRKTGYEPAELDAWSRRIAETGWEEAFIFFKHEQIGPDLAEKLTAAAGKAAR
jgi:uncharacterized protein YecE (DUF72 family)